MTFDEQLGRTFDTLTDRIRQEIATQLDAIAAELKTSVENERAAAALVAHQAGLVEGKAAGRADELAAGARLAEAVRRMDQARSLSEILDTLIGCAGREAARVGVLLVRGDELRGWRFIGFGSPLDDEAPAITMAVSTAGIVGTAVRDVETVSGDNLADVTAPPFAVLPAGREMLAVPIPMSGQVVAVLYADQGMESLTDANLRVAWPGTLEVMARHAARCLESLTAFRAAQVMTERPDVPGSSSSVDDLSARRYARLLISEIKLYHESDVIVGRRERDLAARLGGEIARARALYEQRVPDAVRRSADYFQTELVRILADGDAALLSAAAEMKN
jgi:hypothetical protein